MRKRNILLITFVCVSFFGFSQLKERKAAEYFAKDEFSLSAPIYQEIVNKELKLETVNYSTIQKLAISYEGLKDYGLSAKYYGILEKHSLLQEKDYINYIQVLKILKRYPDASAVVKAGLINYPDNKILQDWEEKGVLLTQLYNRASAIQLESTNLNSGKGDFAPYFHKEGVTYVTSSLRKGFLVDNYKRDNSIFLKIKYAHSGESPVEFNKNILLKDNFLTRFHNGPVVFDSTNTIAIVTKNNNPVKGQKKVKLGLYLSYYSEKEEMWGEEELFPYNDPEYNVGLACFSTDQKGIYFVSDMPGGIGGTDIYYSERRNGEWQKPVNLGPTINTELNELFPFVTEDNILYFSSNGHFGLGGLDLFKVDLNNESNRKVINLGVPLNSSNDDFTYISASGNKEGYISSDRDGFVDKIYYWKGDQLDNPLMHPVISHYVLVGQVYDRETGNVLSQADLKITFNDTVTQNVFSNENGGYVSSVLSRSKQGDWVDLSISVEKEGYVTHAIIARQDLGVNDSLFINFPMVKMQLGRDIAEIIELEPIYYDFDKATLRSKSKLELDRVAQFLNEHPNISIELRSHTDCWQTQEYNLELSQRRAESATNYLSERISNASERILPKGFGKSQPLFDCDCEGKTTRGCTEEENQLNRRTEFIIVKE